MKVATFLLALAATTWSAIDFWRETRSMLQLREQLGAEFEQFLRNSEELAQQNGAPPRADEVQQARLRAAETAEDRKAIHHQWFRGAETAIDYLQQGSDRAARSELGRAHTQLQELLFRLPSEARTLLGTSNVRLGLPELSLTRPLPEGTVELNNATQRGVAAQWVIAAVEKSPPLAIRGVSLTRSDDSHLELPLRLRIQSRGTITTSIVLLEALLERSDSVPPRILTAWQLTRVPRSEWSDTAPRLPEPPVESSITLEFHFPHRTEPVREETR